MCFHVVYWSFVSALFGKLGSRPPISGSVSADSSGTGVTGGGDVTCKAVSVSCMSSVVSVTSSKDVSSSSSSTERSGIVGIASATVSGGMLSVLSLTVGCLRAGVSTPALLLLG